MTGRCRAAWSKPTRFLAVAIGVGWIGYFLACVLRDVIAERRTRGVDARSGAG